MYYKNGLKSLRDNLNNGLLILFTKRPREEFFISFDQSALLVLFYTIVTFFGSLYLSLPDPEFNIYGITNIAKHIFFVLLVVYLVSKITKKDEIKLPLFIALFSVWPWLFLAWLIIGNNSNFDYWDFYGKKKNLYILYNLWMIFIFIKSVSYTTRINKRELIFVILIFIFFVSTPLHYLGNNAFWYPDYKEDDEYSKYSQLNVEDTYYKQFNIIEELKLNILPERKGKPDIYFVGFGGDSSQDVFMKEIQYASDLFDNKFGTKGRSVTLINNINTYDTIPIASKNNLNLVIQHIGKLINPEEDILFLYLTSHGSKQQMSVDFSSLSLNDIEPHDLVEILQRSGIKYKIVIVSACYSGVFVEPLKDDFTIVMTASALDKTSFGCSDESDFTYLGKAVFYEQLNHNFNFIEAFPKAISLIAEREKNEGRKPSEPQLFIGEKIKSKIEDIAQELEQSTAQGRRPGGGKEDGHAG